METQTTLHNHEEKTTVQKPYKELIITGTNGGKISARLSTQYYDKNASLLGDPKRKLYIRITEIDDKPTYSYHSAEIALEELEMYVAFLPQVLKAINDLKAKEKETAANVSKDNQPT